MDRVTVTTAVIGLIAVSKKMTDSYWNVDGITKDSHTTYNMALKEVKQCRSTINLLYNTLAVVETGELESPGRQAWVSIDSLVVVLTDMVLAFSELETILAAVAERLKLPGVTMEHLSSQYGTRITALSNRIKWQNLSMTTMTTILKCKGDSDAEHSRTALELRIERLLTSSPPLAARMRQLQDIYGARAFLHSSRGDAPYPTGYVEPAPDGTPRNYWSVFTNYTLMDFPMLSVVPLPLMLNEIRDGSVFYTLDYARDVSQESDNSPPRSSGSPNLPPTPPAEPASPPSGAQPAKKKKFMPMIRFRRLRKAAKA